MFRSADGAGLEHLYLCGITGSPENPRLAKTALGAEQSMPWSSHPNAMDLALRLKEEGFNLWALERTAKSSLIRDFPSLNIVSQRVVLIVGNERAGVDPGLLALCNRVIEVPMAGGKGSLNAAVAFGIAVYALRYGDIARLDSGRDNT